jgi:hypothetical protein
VEQNSRNHGTKLKKPWNRNVEAVEQNSRNHGTKLEKPWNRNVEAVEQNMNKDDQNLEVAEDFFWNKLNKVDQFF